MRWFALLFGLVLILAVIAFASVVGMPSRGTNATSSAILLDDRASNLYQNTQFGFTMLQPASSSPLTSGFEQYLPATKNPVIGYSIPKEVFSGTNLVEAGVYVGASSDVDSVNACPSAADGEKSAGTQLLGGSIFNVFTSIGAAAGNQYDETIYRTVRNGNCYEITEVVHSGTIGNYPEGAVKQFDAVAIKALLRNIVLSFKFTASANSGVQGTLKIACESGAVSPDCQSIMHVIEAYQGGASVGLFKTSSDGSFRAELPTGRYELRVDAASTTRCASVGIIVPENSYITTNISCNVAE